MFKKYFAMTVIAASVAIAGCSSDDDDDEETDGGGDGGGGGGVVSTVTPGVGTTSYDFIVNSTEHTTLRTLIDLAGLDETLDAVGAADFTIFAPDNEALDAALAATLTAEQVTELNTTGNIVGLDTTVLSSLILYHAVAGNVDSTTLTDSITTAEAGSADPAIPDPFIVATALTGEELSFNTDPNGVLAALITDSSGTVHDLAADSLDNTSAADATAATGLVHNLDSLLVPASLDLTTLVAATGGGGGGGGGDGSATGLLADLLNAETESFTVAIDALAAAYGGGANVDAFNTAPWTLFLPSDATLGSVTVLTDLEINGHLHPNAALTEADLALAIGGAPLAAAGNTTTTFDVTDDGAGAPLVGGFAVTYIGEVAAGGAQVYSIAGVLPAAAAP